MKRYTRAATIFCVVLAFAGLVVYRYEYIQLRRTFQMFSLSSSDWSVSELNCLVLNQSLPSEKLDTFSSPSHVWFESSGFHIYSAFRDTSNELFMARAIGIGDKIKVPSFKCHIWYNYRDAVFSSAGTFSYIVHEIDQHDTALFEFFCKETDPGMKGTPSMLVLVETSNYKYFVPIFKPIDNSLESLSALCVYPDDTGMSKRLMVEFLSYYEVIGFTDIIIYDNGMHYDILDKMNTMISASKAFRSFSVLPWNAPFKDKSIMNRILEKDCLYRTANIAQVTVVLDWKDYILFKELNYQNPVFNSYSMYTHTKIHLPQQICCVDKNDARMSEKTWPQFLRKTYCYPITKRDKLIILNPKLNAVLGKISVNEISLSTYQACNNAIHKKAFYDPKPEDLVGRLLSSKILRLWLSGTFF